MYNTLENWASVPSNYILKEYDANLADILHRGFNISDDRTGVGTLNLFNLSTTVDISTRAPILTKRKVFWKSVVKEVLWYISGSHSIKELEDSGCGLWTPWKSDEFTEKHGLPEGSGGYIYGHNLIHFGAEIGTDEQGFNQLDYVIDTLRANPASRQACFTFWRPDTNAMARLPACHAFYTFIVSPDEDGKLTVLNCHMFQRSNDYPIGVGMANLLTGTIFTRLIAQQLGMTTGELYHTGAHCHIYKNAIGAVTEYVGRDEEPASPFLHINEHDSIYDYTIDDFSISEYNPLPAIKFAIAV